MIETHLNHRDAETQRIIEKNSAPLRLCGSKNLGFLLLAAAILLGAWALRSVDLLRLPMFVDETTHLQRTHQALAGDLWAGLWDSKWLYPVALMPFGPTGPEGPWIARAVSALCGVLTAAAVIALGRALGGTRRAGWIAGALYAAIPMTVFHDRQALVDPMLGMFAALSLVIMARLVKRPSPRLALLLAALLAGAYLTKLSAIATLALPPLAALMLWRRQAGGWRDSTLLALPGVELILRTRDRDSGFKALLLSLAAVGIAAALIFAVFQLGNATGARPESRFQISGSNMMLGDLLTPEVRAIMRGNLITVGQVFWVYLGPVFSGLVILAAVRAVFDASRRRAILFLLIPGLLAMALPLLTRLTAAWMFAPRYLHINAAPLAVLAAMGLAPSPRVERGAGGVRLILLAAALIPALWWDFTLIRDPRGARLLPYDESTYLTGRWAGWGRVDLAATLEGLWQDGAGPRIDALGYDQNLVQINWLDAYLGPRVGVFDELRPDDASQREQIAAWLGDGHRVFFLEHSRGGPMPDAPHGARLEPRWTIPVNDGELRVYEVVGASGDLAGAIYDSTGDDPLFMTDEHAALAAALNADPDTAGPVIVFPASHAPLIAARTPFDLRPLRPEAWPLTPDLAAASLADLDLGEAGTPVDVVLVNEARSDPGRILMAALAEWLYWLDEAWFGPLHRLRFVTGPADLGERPLGARFEGGIALNTAALDSERAPGEAIRVALAWETPAPIADSFHVFAHVVDARGTLVAQHDGIPAAGLLPMPSWEPGTLIGDRFAIPLPADLPPGIYEVRVGIYAPASGLRLPVLDAPEHGGDYVVVGRVRISGSAR